MKNVEHRCTATVYPPGMRFPRGHQCTRAGAAERNGQWFCKQHDPDVVATKRAEENAAWKKRQREQEAIKQTAQALAKRLGCPGQVHYNSGNTARTSGYTRDLVISFHDAETLADELEEFRAREDARWKG